jgi:HD-like signal output (HDOD) protein/ActR/RegA family two-component response regulator
MMRVLFVDDEPLILQAMGRMLHALRGEYEFSFVEGGRAAACVLERGSYDVLVTDVRMPGLDGAALLALARDKYPQMARIVLSGETDARTVMRLLPLAHRILCKPCEMGDLRAVLERSVRIAELKGDGALRALVGGMSNIPSFPDTHARLLELLGAPDPEAEQVAALIARDPGLSAKVLQLVNSAFFGLVRRVESVHEAALYLGTATLRAVVYASEIASAFPSTRSIAGLALETLERHGLEAAALARRLARLACLPPAQVELVTASALLHDAGLLVLASRAPDRLERALTLARARTWPLHTAELALHGSSHAEVGAYVLGLWGLPAGLVEGIAAHHQGGSQAHVEPAAAHVLRLVEALLAEPHETPEACPLDPFALDALGLAAKVEEIVALARRTKDEAA